MTKLLVALLLPAVFLPAGERRASKNFQTSDRCLACHNGLTTASGEDVSIGFQWRASMMANSSRDPYWQAGVRRETMEHPESKAVIEDECAICHMPMSRFESKQNGHPGQVFSHLPFKSDKPEDRLAADGVSCSLCHQISKEKLGTRESFVGGFVLSGDNTEYGPFKIEAGQTRIMRTSTAGFHPNDGEQIRKSEMCATCHTLYTKALGAGGQVVGELPEQMPYQEWLHSEFRDQKSCQACHMPVVKEDVPISKVLGVPREGVSRHVFVGGNFFMLGMLNRFRGDLSVTALPEELSSASARAVTYLQTEAAKIAIDPVTVRDGRVIADIAIENLGGHKLPTAYPSRRAWLHVTVRDRSNKVVFESGVINPQGAIQGNDNDADPARFEPHYNEITSADQVQIYESIMVTPADKVTTTLLSASRYVKDNRLLPRGFDKRTADKDIAVIGGAADDADFEGGRDRVRYSVAVGDAQGPFQVEAELMYQPISYRWAANLRSLDTVETRRFNGYYDAMASASSIIMARAESR